MAGPTVKDEAWVKKEVKLILKNYKVFFFMPQAGPYGTSGIPDFVCCYKGKFLSIETKARGNKPTALQDAQMAKIRKADGIALVINEHNLRTLIDVLEGM